MIGRIKSEYGRFIVRQSKLEALGQIRPITSEQADRAFHELTRFMDRAGTIRKMQKQLLDLFEIVEATDFHVKQSTKKQVGEEHVQPLILALQKLAAFTGASKIRRVSDGEIIRVNRLDGYVPPTGRRNILFVFSTSPRPGVYAWPLDALDVNTKPAYEPITTTEEK